MTRKKRVLMIACFQANSWSSDPRSVRSRSERHARLDPSNPADPQRIRGEQSPVVKPGHTTQLSPTVSWMEQATHGVLMGNFAGHCHVFRSFKLGNLR